MLCICLINYLLYSLHCPVIKPDEHGLTIEPEIKLEYLIDITVAYPDGGDPLDVLNILHGIRPPCDTHLYYRIYPINQVSVNYSADQGNSCSMRTGEPTNESFMVTQ